MFLRQSTAVDVLLGPFVNSTDGSTTEEALSLLQADLNLTKNGGAAAQKDDATTATHLYGGSYKVPLNATDTGTLGHLRLMCKKTGALPIIRDFLVIPANAYDSLVGGSDLLDTNASQVGGAAPVAGPFLKNTEFAAFPFPIFSIASRTPMTGAEVTAQRSIDGGEFAACDNAVEEIGTSGIYKIKLSAADLNGDVVALQFTATGAFTQVATIATIS